MASLMTGCASQLASKAHLPVSEAGPAAQHGTAQQQPRQRVTHSLVHQPTHGQQLQDGHLCVEYGGVRLWWWSEVGSENNSMGFAQGMYTP